MANQEDENLTTIQKVDKFNQNKNLQKKTFQVTRSLSVKIGRSSEENGNRIGAKKSLPAPKRIEADSWIQGNHNNQTLKKETPGKTRSNTSLIITKHSKTNFLGLEIMSEIRLLCGQSSPRVIKTNNH